MDLEGLSTICAGLGIIEEDDDGQRIGYSKTEFCSENLKNLQRFLRRDNPETRDVFKQVCKWNTVSKDLIPIIEHCQGDRDLVISAVKVLVFLTMPIDYTSNDISQQIEYLWGLKAATSRNVAIAVIVSLLEGPLENLESETFTEDDWKLVQLVLTLFRNILAVQDISVQQKASGAATQYLSLRERFLELLFHENVVDLILVLSQHVGDSCRYLRQDNLLLLEIFHYIFLGQDPELIVKASVKGSKACQEVNESLNSLKSIMVEEEGKRRVSRLRNLDRHSQFSGTFTKLSVDGSKSLFKGNPGNASCDSLIKSHNVQRGHVKRTAWDHGRLCSPREKILELLYNFTNQFISGAYNGLMQSVREDIEKEHIGVQQNDIVVFFQVAQFITAFQHHKFLILKPKMMSEECETLSGKYVDETLFQGDICGPIAATMNEAMFLLVISKWHSAFECLKENNDYKSLSAAGSLMKNMIRMLDLVLKLPLENSKEPQTARILLYKIFYDQTDHGLTQFLVNLIKSFNAHKQPKSDLADLVEMVHVVVRLLENLQTRGTLRVSKKSKRRRKKKVVVKTTEDEILVKGQVNAHTTEDERLVKGQVNAQDEVGKSTSEALRDSSMAMELPEDSSYVGNEESTSIPNQNEELSISPQGMGGAGGDSTLMESGNSSHKVDDRESETGDSSEDDQEPTINEVDFNVYSFVSTFANNTIIQNLCWLLKFYKSNSIGTNHYILCMLRRICDDLELSPMIYQLSLLKIFYDILAEQKSSNCKKYENIVSFLTNLARKMLRKMKNQPLLFVEVLFWKTRRECHYINSESMVNELGDLKKQTKKWGSASVTDDGEVGPVQSKGSEKCKSIADSLGEDEADFILPNDQNHQIEKDPYDTKRRKVMDGNEISDGEMNKNLTSISSHEIAGAEHYNSDNAQNEGHRMEDISERVPKRKKRLVFDQELEAKIRSLFEKFKGDRRCNRLIAEDLDLGGGISPAQVSRKLKHLGLKVGRTRLMLHDDDDDDLSAAGVSQIQAEEALESGSTLLGSNKLEKTSGQKRSSSDLRQDNVLLGHVGVDGNVVADQIHDVTGGTKAGVVLSDNADPTSHQELNDKLADELEDLEDDMETIAQRSAVLRRKRKIVDIEGDGTKAGVILSDNADPTSHQKLNDKLADELEDLEDDMETIAQRSAVLRRKRKMVVDIEGDGTKAGVVLSDNADPTSHQELNDKLADELEDSVDDTETIAQRSAVLRRKRKMVVDIEDDD